MARKNSVAGSDDSATQAATPAITLHYYRSKENNSVHAADDKWAAILDTRSDLEPITEEEYNEASQLNN